MRRLLVALVVAELLGSCAPRVASVPRATVAPPVETLSPTLQGLRARFEAAADWPRLVLLLSPS
jgi:hypothetical protein